MKFLFSQGSWLKRAESGVIYAWLKGKFDFESQRYIGMLSWKWHPQLATSIDSKYDVNYKEFVGRMVINYFLCDALVEGTKLTFLKTKLPKSIETATKQSISRR